MYSPRLISTLNEIAHRFAPITQKAIVDVLSQPKYINTGIGAASVNVDVIEGNESDSPQLKITFADHLVVLNKSKPQWTRSPNMDKLIEWAETKKPTRQAAEKLAFAVAWNQKKYDTWKPKLWRKKSLSAVLKEMNEQMVKSFDEAIEADLVVAATGK